MHPADVALLNGVAGQATSTTNAIYARYRTSATKWKIQIQTETLLEIEKRSLDDLMATSALTEHERYCLEERKFDIDDMLYYIKSHRRRTEPEEIFSKLGESQSKLETNIRLALATRDTARAERERISHTKMERERVNHTNVMREQVNPAGVRIASDQGVLIQGIFIGVVVGAGVACALPEVRNRIRKTFDI